MKKLAFLAVFAMLIAACTLAPANTSQDSLQSGDSAETSDPSGLADSVEKDFGSGSAVDTQSPDCLGSDESEIGQGIADQYEGISYEDVLLWFCNGAEFEDIILALQSAENSDASPDEILVMLADGFTWDEIWQLLGISG